MNGFKADLHIHTVLSPCGDLEMSPTAIVDRALARGLDMIAISDHNTTRQVKVTQRIGKEKEETAVRAQNEQFRSNLLRSISHDLRTPLTAITGNASNLLRDGAAFDDDTRGRLYQDIYDDSVWLTNLVENLLSVSRIEEGKIQLKREVELLDDVIDEALLHIDRHGAEHTIAARPCGELLLVKIDARLIVQVLINLVNNAIQYTPRGSTIQISTARRGQYAAVSVADDGCSRCFTAGRSAARTVGAAWAWGWRSAAPSCRRTAGRSACGTTSRTARSLRLRFP